MASSSSKQAELRRLMKLQRERKELEEQQKKAPKSILKKSTKTSSGGLTSLLTGYDDSSSDSEQEGKVSWPTDNSKLETTHVIPGVKKKAVVTTEPPDTRPAKESPAKAEIDSKPAAAKKEPEVDSKTWDEFQALLNDDTTDATSTAPNDNEPRSDETKAAASMPAPEPSSAPPEQESAMSAQETMAVEQTSYEARVAQLRLRVAARRRHEKAAPTVPTYTPELAMLDDEDESSNKRSADDALTPMEILRLKRQKAKRHQDES